MKVLVIGAAGKSGKLIVERAVAAGHTVTALVHQHKEEGDHKNEDFPAGVEIVHGDARNPGRLDQVMTGQNAVIDAIGGTTPFKDTDLESTTARVVVDTMQREGVKRLLVISVLGAGDSVQHAGFFYEHLLMPTFLRGALKDKNHMESEIQYSGLDFVIVRPPFLTDSDPKGTVEIVEGDAKASKITRADLAQFLVDQLTSNRYLGRAITIANPS
jgi:putative NADH-flavin reductase